MCILLSILSTGPSKVSLSLSLFCRDVVGVSDWDLMMQRRKEAMARARKRRRKDIDINASDDFIMNLIGGMKMAAQEDKQLNLAGKAATKKLQMLPTIMSHLKKYALYFIFSNFNNSEQFRAFES